MDFIFKPKEVPIVFIRDYILPQKSEQEKMKNDLDLVKMDMPGKMVYVTPKNIYQRLNEVMKEVAYIQKGAKTVNNQYRFVSHDSVVAALRGPMVTHGIVMAPTITELTQDGNRTVAKMEVAFINIDDPQDRVTVTYYGYGIDTQDKGVGKAVSYAVKYALLKVFALETGDDVEKDNIEYVPASAAREDDVKDLVVELLESYPAEEMSIAVAYIENWKSQLRHSKGSKWVDSFVQGVKKAVQAKDKFCKAVSDWHTKQNTKE